jgi:hypothetical protein
VTRERGHVSAAGGGDRPGVIAEKVVTHPNLETPGLSLDKLEGNIAVNARVSDIVSKFSEVGLA